MLSVSEVFCSNIVYKKKKRKLWLTLEVLENATIKDSGAAQYTEQDLTVSKKREKYHQKRYFILLFYVF